jgi:hypothetical protein
MPFIRGLDLARMLYAEEVSPLLARRFAGLSYAAATLGMCSEVLGLDDEVSRDHEWGPRVTLFLSAEDHARHASDVAGALRDGLPATFHGIPMVWRTSGVDLHDTRERALYHVSVRTVAMALGFCGGSPPAGDPDWLRISEQHLLEFTSGAVYRDDAGDLSRAREALRYYPDNVLRFLLLHEWGAVNRHWFPIGRMGARGDRLGVRLQAGQVARRLARVAFMVSRAYIPYEKWVGTLFAGLPVAAVLAPLLDGLLAETRWERVEEWIAEATAVLVQRQNALGIAPAVPVESEPLDDGRHHVRGAFRRAWTALAESLEPPLDALLERQPSMFDDRSQILAQEELGKRALFAFPEGKAPSGMETER